MSYKQSIYDVFLSVLELLFSAYNQIVISVCRTAGLTFFGILPPFFVVLLLMTAFCASVSENFLLPGFLLQVHNYFHGRFAVGINKLICVVVFLECKTVADERFKVHYSARYVVNGCDIVFVAIHH